MYYYNHNCEKWIKSTFFITFIILKIPSIFLILQVHDTYFMTSEDLLKFKAYWFIVMCQDIFWKLDVLCRIMEHIWYLIEVAGCAALNYATFIANNEASSRRSWFCHFWKMLKRCYFSSIIWVDWYKFHHFALKWFSTCGITDPASNLSKKYYLKQSVFAIY